MDDNLDNERLRRFAERIGIDFGVETEPPDWLPAAIDTVLRDMQKPHPIGMRLRYRRKRDGSIMALVNGAGFLVPTDVGREGLLAAIAFFLQDQVYDQADEAWGEARPGCPTHAHPADPRVIDAEAVWVCPRDSRILARIGRLA